MGGFVASVTAGYVAAASIFFFFRSRESVVEYLVIHTCFVLLSSVASGPYWLLGKSVQAPRRGKGCISHERWWGTLQKQGLTVLPLLLRPSDGFRISSRLEISLYVFLEHGAVEMLRKLLLSGPGSSPGEMSIMSLLMLQRCSKRSLST